MFGKCVLGFVVKGLAMNTAGRIQSEYFVEKATAVKYSTLGVVAALRTRTKSSLVEVTA